MVEEKKGYRIKGNQKGRTDWVKKRVETHERELRSYEKETRTYEDGRKGIPIKEERSEKKRENSEWGFWKKYGEGYATRVTEWKKGVLQKKSLGKTKGKNVSWDRSNYLDGGKMERNERRSLKQNRRYVRSKEKRRRKEESANQVERRSEESKEPSEETRETWKANPRRQRGYEERPNWEKRDGKKGEGKKSVSGRWGENQINMRRIWMKFEKERDGEITRRRKRGKVVHGYEETDKDWGKLVKREEDRKERETRRSGTNRVRNRLEKEKRRRTLQQKIDWRKIRVKIWSPHGKRRRRYGKRDGETEKG